MNLRTILFFLVALAIFAICQPALATWTIPVPVTEINTQYEEWSPFLSFDGLTLYFSRVRTNVPYYGRLYQAERDSPSGPFASVKEISELNQPNAYLLCPWVSPDNLRMYYQIQSSAAGTLLKFSERTSTNDPWPQGMDISGLTQLGNDLMSPKLTADELTVFFHRHEIYGVQHDIWMATRPDRNSPFGQVRMLDEIDTASYEVHPFPSADGLKLYFASDRSGSYQLFMATRESLDSPFGNIEHLSSFDAPTGYSCFPDPSYDGIALYFMRQAQDRSTRDIYVSYIPEPATLLLLGLGAVVLKKKC